MSKTWFSTGAPAGLGRLMTERLLKTGAKLRSISTGEMPLSPLIPGLSA
jgi:hypothetical protein